MILSRLIKSHWIRKYPRIAFKQQINPNPHKVYQPINENNNEE